MSYIKIQKAYTTAAYECSVVTNVLSAWITNDKKVVLLGYGCKPTEDGFAKARPRASFFFPRTWTTFVYRWRI